MISAPNRIRAAEKLRERMPELYEQIRLTKQMPSALRLWGYSLNHDEHADATIVDPRILEVLTDLTGVPMEGEILHAGLQHTYGYLFSLIETPYGYKRDRWTNGELDAALGFASPVLFALPAHGTLLSNVSYFIGRIAFRGCRRKTGRLRRIRSHVAPALVNFDYRRLRVARLTETISSPTNKKVKISLVSDFVRYSRIGNKRRAGSSNTALLVYSLVDSRERIRKLITAFPISLETVRSLTDPQTLGDRQSVKLSYNISVPSFHQPQMPGSRRLSRDVWFDDEQPTTPPEPNTDIVTTLETENFIDTYQLVAEWIRFADAKAAAVLTACGALAGVLIPTLRGFLNDKTHIVPGWEFVGIALFAIWLGFLMACSRSAFRCIQPFRKDGKHPAIGKCNHFHPAGIATRYALDESERFANESSRLQPGEFMKEVMAGLHIDSHISANKYQHVSLSIRLLGWSAIFGFLYLIASQF